MDRVRDGLLAGGVLAVAFLAGQPWRGASSMPPAIPGLQPANSFFYLLTAVHGLHVAGGLVALARATPGAGAARD